MSVKRDAGFYWVYVKDGTGPQVALTFGDGWLLVGRVAPLLDEGVYVLSSKLCPPEQRSGCVHPPEARHEKQCMVCGTWNVE